MLFMPTINSVGLSFYPVPGVLYLSCRVCDHLVGRWTVHVLVSEGGQCMLVCFSNISFSRKEGNNLKENMAC